jgi:hypothetical protein
MSFSIYETAALSQFGKVSFLNFADPNDLENPSFDAELAN